MRRGRRDQHRGGGERGPRQNLAPSGGLRRERSCVVVLAAHNVSAHNVSAHDVSAHGVAR
jgi:hypothetical protein